MAVSKQKFQLKELQIEAKIHPKHLNDPMPQIELYLQSLLLKYSQAINGIPLTYKIQKISKNLNIYDGCPFLFAQTDVSFLILTVAKGDTIHVSNNLYCGNFLVENDTNTLYTGLLKITEISNYPKTGLVKICGEKVDELDDSDS
ncbi:hypothetical protein EDEG_01168 [Edhazardia aedis USNM 41457]|uniref:RNA polymerase Rpb7-like N-terminal domain-containing protein n=1 Tax=Edhazardia aedis (strain USNM 41457) TaxID=1003232 RepID=J9DA84_EDHAE|nr:hypothetical protein EDEG_01168 [Edhazardia aedis USNM 41457]|eukprot:EJW04641.1 hypothetical protein EDEG_01168 [Edhazardia aedis USNM 41457]